MRRRKLLVALAALGVLVAAGTVVLWPHADRITQPNSDRIREGMTRAEVELILGMPGDYRTVRTAPPPTVPYRPKPTPAELAKDGDDREHIFDLKHSPGVEKLTWLGDEGDVCVWMIGEQVAHADFSSREKVAQTPLENLLWRTKRQWHRWFP
jgi:hypothetical protein